jgi:hypothetical protein
LLLMSGALGKGVSEEGHTLVMARRKAWQALESTG